MRGDVTTGIVLHLFRKTTHGAATQPVHKGEMLLGREGSGIAGDVHAHRLSPRQILITSAHELAALALAPGVLRENMVIAIENPLLFVPGATIVTGRNVEIRLTMYCEPCARIRSVAPDLKRLVHRRGVLGYFVTGGPLVLGDSVTLHAGTHSPLPDSPLHRFQQFVGTIPSGRVVRYRDVTIGMGAAESFVRALPGYIRRSGGLGLPLHRIVTAAGALPGLVSAQAALLDAEGVPVRRQVDARGATSETVDLQTYLWSG